MASRAENGRCQPNVPSSGGQSRSALCIWQDFDFEHLVELFWSAGMFPHVYHLNKRTQIIWVPQSQVVCTLLPCAERSKAKSVPGHCY